MNEDHAVTNVVFQLKLDEFVEPPVLSDVDSSDVEWKEALPAVSPLPPVPVDVGGQSIEAPGIQSAIVRPNGKPIWALRLRGNEISVECTAYTRWKDVWGVARAYLEQAHALVLRHQPNANIMEMGLAVTDRFVTQDAEYTAGELFLPGGMIGDAILRRGGIWHSNTGWLELGEFRILNSLNVQATCPRRADGRMAPPYSFTVRHNQQFSTADTPIPVKRLDEIISSLHLNNKKLVREALATDMLNQIGLTA